MINDKNFEQALRENGIPPRPLVLELVSLELRKEWPDLRVLEKTLRSDVAIAAGIIKTANSPYFGAQRRVRSVLEALEILGLRKVSQAVACVALRALFPNARLERFWDASVKIAELSAWLAAERRWTGILPEDAYTFGLFRDCGIAILWQRMPFYSNILAQANTDSIQSFTEIESAVLPMTHAQVGAMMSQSWWMPAEISEGIRHHHDPIIISSNSSRIDIPPDTGALIAISQLAEFMLQQASGMSQTREWDKLGMSCMSRLELLDDDLLALQSDANKVISKN